MLPRQFGQKACPGVLREVKQLRQRRGPDQVDCAGRAYPGDDQVGTKLAEGARLVLLTNAKFH